MPTKFNDGVDDFDVFNEPSIPEETTLSSAGTGSRNHPEHHRDMGDAIEAMQRNMALGDHDHSGGGGHFDTGKLVQVNTHEDADTDSGDTAIHHTLGSNPGQAAAGNHDHGFVSGYQICTSTTRPFDPAVGTTIYETDTNRVRVWSTFADNVVITGVDSTDNYNRTLPNDMGTALWEQTYDTPSGQGKWAIPDGTQLSWIDQGNAANRCIARRIDPADAITATNDQVITWQTGDEVIDPNGLFQGGASNDKYFRMSADKQSYIRLQVGWDWIILFYTVSGKANEKELGRVSCTIDTNTPLTTWRGQMKDREFTLYRLGELLVTIKDTKALSAMGPTNRGWGNGAVAGAHLVSGQTTPANENWVRIQDLVYFASANRWTLLSVASVPVIRLRQSKIQKILYSGTAIEWTEELEDNFGFFTPSDPTNIVMKESGLYQIECGLQWDPQYVPDIASASLLINGTETTIKEQRFMRGNTFTPGFSQTLSVQGKLRFAAGDVLQVKAKYTAGSSLLDKIFSYFDPATKVNSRIDIHFMSP